MKYYFLILIFSLSFPKRSSSNSANEPDFLKKSLDVAIVQSKRMANALRSQDGRLPRSFDPQTGELMTSDSRWWCSGFFSGVLWYLYEYSNDGELRHDAEMYMERVEKEQHNTVNHDVGFMLYCSYGNAFRLTGNKSYADILMTTSRSLSTRFNPRIGLIRSWSFNKNKWQFPVIIDNMMNLELLMWAFHYSGDSTFYHVADSHAQKTILNHYRPDNSCFHVVSYDTTRLEPHIRQTHQGASDSSIWARGQAWGLYGYTMMYRETGKKEYLEQAVKIAELMINHPNMPADKIPYWDYLAPGIPNEERDASAAAIMASALLELSNYVESQRERYFLLAEQQLKTLASDQYLAQPGTNGNFILKHSVGSKPHHSEVDVPLTYADYYFVEALIRYKKILNLQTKQK